MSGSTVSTGGEPSSGADGGSRTTTADGGTPMTTAEGGRPMTAAAGGELRARILRDPDLVLGDPALMRALVARTEGPPRGGKVIDLRAVAMARLEARLDRLESAHRTVIAAAYENLAGTQQVHRAILRLLDAESLEGFLEGLSGDVASILRVGAVRLLVEGTGERWPSLAPGAGEMGEAGGTEAGARSGPDAVLRVVPPGSVAERVGCGAGPPARVSLRRGAPLISGEGAPRGIESEAWLTLELGHGCLPGLLVLGSRDPEQFAPGQGTELLEFLAGVFERAMRRWLA